jgi:DNA-binding CsgD family transcriptional regulator
VALEADHELIGRAAELGALAEAVKAVDGGNGRLLAVSGEAGIGKTRLLAELAEDAQARRHLVLRGRATELEQEIPFAVFLDALDEYLASLNQRLLEPLGADRLAELGAIFPALAHLGQGTPSKLPSERYRAHRAVRALLEALAGRRPLVLVLDDVHWADGASQELLAYLLRHRVDAPLLVALGLRPGQAPVLLSKALDLAEREGDLKLLRPGPLQWPEARELLGAELDEAGARSIYEECGGNPLFLEELGRSEGLRTAGRPAPADSPELADAPPAVCAAIATEVDSLPEQARVLLRAAALVGDPFEPDLAALGAEIDESEALRLLDELLKRELVRPTHVPRRFRFRHPVVRRAVFDSAPAGWRLAAHARLASALASRGAPAALSAHHVERSAKAGDEDAIAVLTEAARASAVRAPAAAAHWLGAALRLLPESAEARRRELLMARAASLGAAGQIEESRAAALECLETMGPAPSEERIRLVALCVSLEHTLGMRAVARERLGTELTNLDAASPARAAILVELSVDRYFDSDFEAMRDAAREALSEESEAGTMVFATVALAVAERSMGDVEEARRWTRAAVERADAIDDSELASRPEALRWLGYLEWEMERFEASLAHFDRGLAISRTTGQGVGVVLFLAGRASPLSCIGRLDEACDSAVEAVEGARLLGYPEVLIWALSIRSWVAACTGDHAAGVAAADEAAMLAEGMEKSLFAAAGGWFRAAARLESGDARGCMGEILEFVGPELQNVEPAAQAQCCELLSRAHLELDELSEAERWAARAEQLAAELDLALPRTYAARARARLELEKGRPEKAARLALEGAAAAEGIGAPVEAAQAMLIAGQAHAASENPDRATELLTEAESELTRWGARGFADQAARALRRLGVAVPRGGRSRDGGDAGALSERELEVAELVAEAMTNRQIAAALHLSEKTIEKHLSSAFSKLGVSSRGEVAREVRRGRVGAGS